MTGVLLRNNQFLPRAQPSGGGPDAGPWDRVGTIVQLDNIGDTVAIGAVAMVGGEKVRIVGALRTEGQVLGDSLRAEDTSGGTSAFLALDDGATAAVSAVGEGRIRYNDATMAVEVSENGGAYTPIFSPSGGGWTDDGAIIRLTTSTDTVAIGTAVMSGAEKIRVIGSSRLEGSVDVTTGDVTVGAVAKVFGADGDTVLGGVVMSGTERLRVVGDARVEGKLTVTGSIDPTDVQLSGGTALFFGSANGATAAVSGAAEGRLRYNNVTGTWQVSTQGGAYVDIATGASAGPWTLSGADVFPDLAGYDVQIGTIAGKAGTEKLRVTGGSTLLDGATGAVPVSGAGTRLMWVPSLAALRAGSVSGTAWDAASVGANTVAFGRDTIASAARAAAFGDDTEAQAAHAISQGFQSVAARIGSVALSNGQFATRGDSQTWILSLRRQSVGAAAVDLTIDGAAPAGVAVSTSNRIILQDSRAYNVRVEVLARNTAASEVKGWMIRAIIKRNVGAATTTLVGTQSKSVIGADAGSSPWDANLLADAVNGALRVEVSGQAGKTINWSGTVRVTEVAV